MDADATGDRGQRAKQHRPETPRLVLVNHGEGHLGKSLLQYDVVPTRQQFSPPSLR